VSSHGKSVIELTELTFAHYRQADWQLHIVDDYPRLTCANQYDETDYNHLHRRWEALGLVYSYEHRADGHTLWLYDKSTLAQPIDPTGIDDSGEIPFRDKAGSLEDDGIREWSPVRRIGSGQTTLASFDYKNPVAQRASAESLNNQGDVFPYEVYENTGLYGFRTHDDGENSHSSAWTSATRTRKPSKHAATIVPPSRADSSSSAATSAPSRKPPSGARRRTPASPTGTT
jgi:type VI secretion system secreted protein VgrG